MKCEMNFAHLLQSVMFVFDVLDDVKRIPLVDGVEEEVTTCSLASSSNDFDVSWPRSSGDSLSAIDLCDPRQLSEFARY